MNYYFTGYINNPIFIISNICKTRSCKKWIS